MKPRITLEPPAKKAPQAKLAPPQRQQFPDVTISCRSNSGRLEIGINLSVAVVKCLGLKGHGKVLLDWHGDKLRVRPSPKLGRTLYSGSTSGRLFFCVSAESFGVKAKQSSEPCKFEYTSGGGLLIMPPAWLKRTSPAGKADPPPTCKKMAGTNPTIKCHACKKATATVECSRCPTLLCDGCWGDHVRTHWHTAVTRSTFTPDAPTRSR